MKLKITSKTNVTDKLTKESLAPGTVFERDEKRAQDFIDAKVAVEVKDGQEDEPVGSLDVLSAEVANINSVEELDALADAEAKGQNRKGAADIFDKRRAELKAKEATDAPKKSKTSGKKQNKKK